MQIRRIIDKINDISVTFYDVGGQNVGTIGVCKGSKPLFVKVAEKSGAKVEKFYARSGNSSPPVVNPVSNRIHIQTVQVTNLTAPQARTAPSRGP
jgi:hypothetical protein